MSARDSRAWWPQQPDQAGALACDLRRQGAGAQLFELLCVAAAEGEWSVFVPAVAALCELKPRAVQNILDNHRFDAGWSLLYGSTGMPPELYPPFMEILKTARRFSGGTAEPRTRRMAVVQQALNSPALRGFRLAPELRAALLG